jgi:hypothetical protein
MIGYIIGVMVGGAVGFIGVMAGGAVGFVLCALLSANNRG